MNNAGVGTSHGGWFRGVLPIALTVCVVAVLWRCSPAEQYQAANPAWDVMTAIDINDVGAVRRALDRGARVDTRSCGTTPLLRAAELGRVQIVELLLDRGADVRATDAFGTALAYAAWNHAGVDTVRLLLRHGADPDLGRRNGWTPLMFATLAGDVDAMTALIVAGAALNARNERGESALDVARETGVPEAEAVLLATRAARDNACKRPAVRAGQEPEGDR